MAFPSNPTRAREQGDAPGLRDAPITTALIVVNTLIFLLEDYWGGSESSATLVRMGAIYGGSSEFFRWPSLLSYGYLHIGALHIGMNMFALWNMGRLLEPLLGGSRFFVLYTLSLLGGGIAISLSPAPHITAGASGALFGLMGAVIALLYRRYRRARVDVERKVIRGTIGRLLLPNVIISLLPGVSFLGHAGGLVVGALIMALTSVTPAAPGSGVPATSRPLAMHLAAIALALLSAIGMGFMWWSFEPWQALH